MSFRIIEGDCIEAMAAMEPNSVDAVVCDPPYGLEFMGKEWDKLGDVRQRGDDDFTSGDRRHGLVRHGYGVDWAVMQEWHHAWATEALRVLKPGGHLLAFGGTRTYHRLTCAIEDAGFEIRDCLAWLYGSGFPKSLNLNGDNAGWGTALKPAFEPIVLARKPLSERNVAANVLRWGVGALNVDGCRIENTTEDREASEKAMSGERMWRRSGVQGAATFDPGGDTEPAMHPAGRWPANVTLDETAAAMLDEQSGELHTQDPASRARKTQQLGTLHGSAWLDTVGKGAGYGDTGGASRFFYCPKADRAERNNGLGHMAPKPAPKFDGGDFTNPLFGDGATPSNQTTAANHHPTVKPIALMAWLCRMVTPKGGTVLDPFTGSGSSGIAALREGFEFIGLEREPEYVEIARARILGDAPLFNVEAV